tara:strand:+ start:10560 stop:12596 length:2037 start_codon:yes stop_codon:yes gene_type:complete
MTAISKVRFFKMVTPPDKSDDTKVSVGNKTIAGSSFSTTISAINSLGATVNSIAVAIKEVKDQNKRQVDRQKRNAALASDAAREKKLEADKDGGGDDNTVAKLVGGGLGFLGNLMKFFKGLIMYKALDWISDPANRERVKTTLERIKKFWEMLVGAFTKLSNWIGENWEKTFGEDKTLIERLQGIAGLTGALAGLAFLANPVGFISNITGILQMVGGGIVNLGKFLGGNTVGRSLLAIGQGVEAYNRTLNDETIAEEDRQSSAIGAGVGSTTGSMVGSTIGASFLGPIGGIIGAALGGFIGENVGKFLGPIAEDFFKGIKEVFDVVMEWFEKLMEPLKQAVSEVFEALGPVMQTIVDKLKEHMPFIEKVMGILGTVVFGPLILLLKGLTGLLKLVPTESEMNEIKDGQETNGDTPEASKGGIIPYRSIGGIVPFNMDFKLPERSQGGWISGPQSGYPVSLDGRGVDFIGHGLEYVAKRSSGGFVIPVDTPHTRRDPGLTKRKAVQANAFGYKVPGFSEGGKINIDKLVTSPVLNLPEFSTGGLALSGGESDSAIMRQMIGSGMLTSPVTNSISVNLTGGESDSNILLKAIKAQQNNVGQNLNDLVGRVKDAASSVTLTGNESDSQIMLKAIKAQQEQVPQDVTEIPITREGKRNPAAPFLVSRFGRNAESSNPVSNFL